MTTSPNIVPVNDAPVGLEDRVKHSLDIQAQLKRDATARAAIDVALATMVDSAAKDLTRKGRGHKGRPAKPRKPAPMSAIRIGRMAEAAWERMTPLERQQGLPLWKLASLANLHFIPVPARKLFEMVGSMMVFQLVKPTVVGHLEALPMTSPEVQAVPSKDVRKFGFAFVQRSMPGMPQALLGIKIFDHEGRVLMIAGQAPLSDWEKISPFTAGIFDGPDELPENWVYRTKAQTGSIEITQFIRAMLPRRQEL